MSSAVRRTAWVLLAFMALLALGWGYGVLRNWHEIASRPVRLAYIICDVALVIPLGVASALGLLRGRRWAFLLFPAALGAFLFDVAHGMLYLIWDNYFGMPLLAGIGILVVLMGYTVLAIRTLVVNWDQAAH